MVIETDPPHFICNVRGSHAWSFVCGEFDLMPCMQEAKAKRVAAKKPAGQKSILKKPAGKVCGGVLVKYTSLVLSLSCHIWVVFCT